MSLPRPIFKGDLYLVTRRTAGRRFFLRPSKKRNRQIEYCIAVAAQRHKIRVHALVAMSNHWHCVASDPEAAMPAFLQDVHAWIAKTINKALGRWENLWATSQTSLVRSRGDDNVLGRIVYTMANPVAAGLVDKGRNWPGLRTCWPDRRHPVKRPRLFRKNGPMPKNATLELHRPPGFAEFGDNELAAHLRDSIASEEAEHRDAMEAAGRTALGRRAIRKQSPYASPTTREPRRKMSPRVAEKDKWRRIEVLQRLQWFLDEYLHARLLWRAGFRDVVFPVGTYSLRVKAGVACRAD